MQGMARANLGRDSLAASKEWKRGCGGSQIRKRDFGPFFLWHNDGNPSVTGMKDTDPITQEEMKEAADTFFPLLRVVQEGMPENASTEDTLKVMEHVANLAHRLRKEKKREKTQQRFGLVPNFKGSFEP